MYIYYYCKLINNYENINIYENKINLNKLSYLIEKYKLNYKDIIKEYWINNVQIISDKKNIKFYKIYDKNIKYNNEYLIKEYEFKNCVPFNFNESHLEEEYILYENIINNIKIVLKKYNDYISLEFETNDLINNNNNFLCYNII